MQTLFRKADSGDIEAILPLWREMMELHSDLNSQYRLVSDAATHVETHLRLELNEPTSLLAVAEHDSAVIAYCRASVRQQSPIFEQRAHGFVSEFHVLPSARRRGIGRSLFQFVRQWFREQGVSRVELHTLNATRLPTRFGRTWDAHPMLSATVLNSPGA